jgi:small subunit ribosomal protein S9
MAKQAPKIINTSGKRKTAVARATVTKGKGRVRINKVPLEVFTPEMARLKILEAIIPLKDRINKVDVKVSVNGGGTMGQASAVRTAIARGFVRYFDDPSLEDTYKHLDRSLLVNDPRRKEPKHQLGRGARKKRQKSYR